MENIQEKTPKHYEFKSFDLFDIIMEITQKKEGLEAFAIGNAIKYIARAGKKDGFFSEITDYEKAIHYLKIAKKIKEQEKEDYEKKCANKELPF